MSTTHTNLHIRQIHQIKRIAKSHKTLCKLIIAMYEYTKFIGLLFIGKASPRFTIRNTHALTGEVILISYLEHTIKKFFRVVYFLSIFQFTYFFFCVICIHSKTSMKISSWPRHAKKLKLKDKGGPHYFSRYIPRSKATGEELCGRYNSNICNHDIDICSYCLSVPDIYYNPNK